MTLSNYPEGMDFNHPRISGKDEQVIDNVVGDLESAHRTIENASLYLEDQQNGIEDKLSDDFDRVLEQIEEICSYLINSEEHK